MKKFIYHFILETRSIIGRLKKQRLKEKIVSLNYYRIAKAETCFINTLQMYNKIAGLQLI